MNIDYAPPRDLMSKLKRRATQAKRARPATLVFSRPILSVTFDDFPKSAAHEGAAVLEAHGGRGTFYAAGGMANVMGSCGLGYGAADLARLDVSGHEIACHSFSHHDGARANLYDTLVDLAKNRDAMLQMGHDAPLTALAYPYGETTSALKAALPPRYSSARGIMPGLNVGAVDLAQLKAYALFGDAFTRARRDLKAGARRKAWMIAFTHDVSPTPSPWGTTPADLDAFLAAAVSLGYALLPVSEALTEAKS